MLTLATMLTSDEFARLAALVYERCGIRLPPEKRTLLSNRLRGRLRAHGLASFDAYYQRMLEPHFSEQELPEFLSAVSTNESHFFRNPRLWKLFVERLIPEFAQRRGVRERALRIWSAAGSSGEEAYTAAILLREHLPGLAGWDITIIASDISRRMLEAGERGLFSAHTLERTDPALRKRWFIPAGDSFQIHDDVRQMVRFRFHNLRERFPMRGFDFVLLRNVLMYFDLPMKLRALAVACDAVAAGGYLFVGDVDPLRIVPELARAVSFERDVPGLYRRSGEPAPPWTST